MLDLITAPEHHIDLSKFTLDKYVSVEVPICFPYTDARWAHQYLTLLFTLTENASFVGANQVQVYREVQDSVLLFLSSGCDGDAHGGHFR
jgi:hypothetical protein